LTAALVAQLGTHPVGQWIAAEPAAQQHCHCCGRLFCFQFLNSFAFLIGFFWGVCQYGGG
jgi:hypothetical protein